MKILDFKNYHLHNKPGIEMHGLSFESPGKIAFYVYATIGNVSINRFYQENIQARMSL